MFRSILFLASFIFILSSCKQNSENPKGQSAKTSEDAKSDVVFSMSGKKAFVYTTALNTDLKMSAFDTVGFEEKKQPLETEICVFVDPGKTFQPYVGIGGAITDASAETFYKMPKAQQDELITAYFDKTKGIGYNIIRTNINSCDFSSDKYTYIAVKDSTLSTFNIDHDKKFKIPMIKAAQQLIGKDIMFYGSPWSPPAWMKSNNNMLKGGKLLDQYHNVWAMYYTKFIKAYEAENIPVWGISVQNEPMATQTWESCIYTAEEERDFIKDHLGPTMEKEGLKDKKIIAWDHNRDMIYQRASTYLNDPEAAKYIWGIGFHWYEDWSGGKPMFDNLRRVYEAYPDKHLFFTEGCAESFKSGGYNNWALGEEYGRSMINDFNNGMVGFTDWNIFLDQTGGPNHVKNFCFAPIHGDTKTGQLIYTNAYYYIGHFSKYIQLGAKRIIAAPTRSQLISTAFLNPDGSVATIVMNESDKDVDYYVWVYGQAAKTVAKARSISTVVVR
jgi:glucosylceramidase